MAEIEVHPYYFRRLKALVRSKFKGGFSYNPNVPIASQSDNLFFLNGDEQEMLRSVVIENTKNGGGNIPQKRIQEMFSRGEKAKTKFLEKHLDFLCSYIEPNMNWVQYLRETNWPFAEPDFGNVFFFDPPQGENKFYRIDKAIVEELTLKNGGQEKIQIIIDSGRKRILDESEKEEGLGHDKNRPITKEPSDKKRHLSIVGVLLGSIFVSLIFIFEYSDFFNENNSNLPEASKVKSNRLEEQVVQYISLKGFIVDANDSLIGGVSVVTDLSNDTVVSTSTGSFLFDSIPGKAGDNVRISLYYCGEFNREEYGTLPGPVKVKINTTTD